MRSTAEFNPTHVVLDNLDIKVHSSLAVKSLSSEEKYYWDYLAHISDEKINRLHINPTIA